MVTLDLDTRVSSGIIVWQPAFQSILLLQLFQHAFVTNCTGRWPLLRFLSVTLRHSKAKQCSIVNDYPWKTFNEGSVPSVGVQFRWWEFPQLWWKDAVTLIGRTFGCGWIKLPERQQ